MSPGPLSPCIPQHNPQAGAHMILICYQLLQAETLGVRAPGELHTRSSPLPILQMVSTRPSEAHSTANQASKPTVKRAEPFNGRHREPREDAQGRTAQQGGGKATIQTQVRTMLSLKKKKKTLLCENVNIQTNRTM